MVFRCFNCVAFWLLVAALVSFNPGFLKTVWADEIIYAQDGRQILLRPDGSYKVLMDPRYYGMTSPTPPTYAPAYSAPYYPAPPAYPYGVAPAAPVASVPPAIVAPGEAAPVVKKSLLDQVFDGEPARRKLRSR